MQMFTTQEKKDIQHRKKKKKDIFSFLSFQAVVVHLFVRMGN